MAEIVVVPAVKPVARPVALIVALAVFDEFQVDLASEVLRAAVRVGPGGGELLRIPAVMVGLAGVTVMETSGRVAPWA